MLLLEFFQISKEQVDYAKHKKRRAMKEITLYPPKCALKIINCRGESTASHLEFSLKLEGIRENIAFNVLLLPSNTSSRKLSCSASGSDSISSDNIRSPDRSGGSDPLLTQSSSGYSSQGSQEGNREAFYSEQLTLTSIVIAIGIDDEPRFQELWNHLYTLAVEWETIAIFLELGEETMAIEKDGTDVKDKLRRVLRKWERLRSRPYSWRTIIDVLEQPAMEAKRIASNIRAEITR